MTEKKPFAFPKEFNSFVAGLDRVAEEAIERCEWWQELKRAHGDWIMSAPELPKDKNLAEAPIDELFFDTKVTRKMFPTEYIIGQASPMYFRRLRKPDSTRIVYACYLHAWGMNSGGTGAGGALAAVLDDAVSSIALYHSKSWCFTKSLNLQFVKPVRPVPGVLRIDADIVKVEGNQIFVEASVKNAKGEVCVKAEGVMVPHRESIGGGVTSNSGKKTKISAAL